MTHRMLASCPLSFSLFACISALALQQACGMDEFDPRRKMPPRHLPVILETEGEDGALHVDFFHASEEEFSLAKPIKDAVTLGELNLSLQAQLSPYRQLLGKSPDYLIEHAEERAKYKSTLEEAFEKTLLLSGWKAHKSSYSSSYFYANASFYEPSSHSFKSPADASPREIEAERLYKEQLETRTAMFKSGGPLKDPERPDLFPGSLKKMAPWGSTPYLYSDSDLFLSVPPHELKDALDILTLLSEAFENLKSALHFFKTPYEAINPLLKTRLNPSLLAKDLLNTWGRSFIEANQRFYEASLSTWEASFSPRHLSENDLTNLLIENPVIPVPSLASLAAPEPLSSALPVEMRPPEKDSPTGASSSPLPSEDGSDGFELKFEIDSDEENFYPVTPAPNASLAAASEVLPPKKGSATEDADISEFESVAPLDVAIAPAAAAGDILTVVPLPPKDPSQLQREVVDGSSSGKNSPASAELPDEDPAPLLPFGGDDPHFEMVTAPPAEAAMEGPLSFSQNSASASLPGNTSSTSPLPLAAEEDDLSEFERVEGPSDGTIAPVSTPSSSPLPPDALPSVAADAPIANSDPLEFQLEVVESSPSGKNSLASLVASGPADSSSAALPLAAAEDDISEFERVDPTRLDRTFPVSTPRSSPLPPDALPSAAADTILAENSDDPLGPEDPLEFQLEVVDGQPPSGKNSSASLASSAERADEDSGPLLSAGDNDSNFEMVERLVPGAEDLSALVTHSAPSMSILQSPSLLPQLLHNPVAPPPALAQETRLIEDKEAEFQAQMRRLQEELAALRAEREHAVAVAQESQKLQEEQRVALEIEKQKNEDLLRQQEEARHKREREQEDHAQELLGMHHQVKETEDNKTADILASLSSTFTPNVEEMIMSLEEFLAPLQSHLTRLSNEALAQGQSYKKSLRSTLEATIQAIKERALTPLKSHFQSFQKDLYTSSTFQEKLKAAVVFVENIAHTFQKLEDPEDSPSLNFPSSTPLGYQMTIPPLTLGALFASPLTTQSSYEFMSPSPLLQRTSLQKEQGGMTRTLGASSPLRVSSKSSLKGQPSPSSTISTTGTFFATTQKLTTAGEKAVRSSTNVQKFIERSLRKAPKEDLALLKTGFTSKRRKGQTTLFVDSNLS